MNSVESSAAGHHAEFPLQPPPVHIVWKEVVPATRVVGLKVASVLYRPTDTVTVPADPRKGSLKLVMVKGHVVLAWKAKAIMLVAPAATSWVPLIPAPTAPVSMNTRPSTGCTTHKRKGTRTLQGNPRPPYKGRALSEVMGHREGVRALK